MPWTLPRPQSSPSSLSRASRLSRSACRAHVFPNPHLALGKSVDEAALDRLFRVPSSYLICIKPGAESAPDKTLRGGTAEKNFFGDQHPPPQYPRVWMTGPPPPLSEGLDLSLQLLSSIYSFRTNEKRPSTPQTRH